MSHEELIIKLTEERLELLTEIRREKDTAKMWYDNYSELCKTNTRDIQKAETLRYEIEELKSDIKLTNRGRDNWKQKFEILLSDCGSFKRWIDKECEKGTSLYSKDVRAKAHELGIYTYLEDADE